MRYRGRCEEEKNFLLGKRHGMWQRMNRGEGYWLVYEGGRVELLFYVILITFLLY